MSIVFVNIPAYGHVNPTLPLVTELASRGRRVIYYNDESLRSRIEPTGVEFRPYPPFDYDAEYIDPNPFQLALDLLTATETLLPWMLEELSREEVSAIIYDNITIWGWYLAKIRGYPAINSTATLVLDQGTLWEVASPTTMSKLVIVSQRQVLQMRKIGKRLEKRYGVRMPAISSIFVNPAPLNLVYTSRAFQPQSNRYDNSYHFVGPSIPLAAPTTDLYLGDLSGRKLIYVSLGTLFNDRLDFFRACLEAFRGDEYWLVMALGNKVDPAELEPLPGNTLVRRYLPQLAILEHADLFISHGGANSINESLYNGVPLLLFPQMVEQGFGARRVEALGAGRIIGEKDIQPGRLREKAESILADRRFKKAAREISQTFRDAGGFRRAADEVEAYLEQKGA